MQTDATFLIVIDDGRTRLDEREETGKFTLTVVFRFAASRVHDEVYEVTESWTFVVPN